jgi:hypothetical protein
MKKVFSELIKSPILQSFFVMIGVIGFFQFIIFPGLTAANTLHNIISGIFAVFVLLFVVFYIKVTFLDTLPHEHPLFEPEPDKEPETELDYNPEAINPKPKKKRKPKPTPKMEVVKRPTNKPKK